MTAEELYSEIESNEEVMKEAVLACLRWMRANCNEWAVRDVIVRKLRSDYASLDVETARDVMNELITDIEEGSSSVEETWGDVEHYLRHTRWFREKAVEESVNSDLVLTSRFAEAKTEPVRRSDKPHKAHGAIVDQYAQLREMQDSLMEQAAAIQALANEKGNLAGALGAEIEKFASEYENQTIRTKKILLKLREIPATTSKMPSWKKYVDWSMGKFLTISTELHKEAQEFLDNCKREIPASKVIDVNKVESLNESLGSVLRNLWNKLSFTGKKIADLEAVVAKIK